MELLDGEYFCVLHPGRFKNHTLEIPLFALIWPTYDRQKCSRLFVLRVILCTSGRPRKLSCATDLWGAEFGKTPVSILFDVIGCTWFFVLYNIGDTPIHPYLCTVFFHPIPKTKRLLIFIENRKLIIYHYPPKPITYSQETRGGSGLEDHAEPPRQGGWASGRSVVLDIAAAVLLYAIYSRSTAYVHIAVVAAAFVTDCCLYCCRRCWCCCWRRCCFSFTT